jgi:hypothetical protein
MYQQKYIISVNHFSENQTFIIPLTITNINDAKHLITVINYGADVWQLQAELLSPSPEALSDVYLPPLTSRSNSKT